ncbi:MAG: type II secretion system F family protein [Terracidiphilus sp.]|nr:type II secretion system F family protein [Terracidiphilus sp.]
MMLIVILAFLGTFTLIAAPLIAATRAPSERSKQVMSALDSALASESPVRRQKTIEFRKQELFSSIPWLNHNLLRLELGPRLRRLLDQADLKWTPGRLLLLCGVCAVVPAYLANLRFQHVFPALLMGLLTGAAPMGWVLLKRAKRMEQFIKELPEALDLMVSGLRAGHSLISTLGLVATECPEPVKSEFRTCFEEQNYGVDMKTAFNNMIRRVPEHDLKIVTSAIMIQRESGGNLAELLDKASETIRQRFRLKRQIRTHTAQGRMTGLILSGFPIFLGILLYFINPDLMSVLWKTPMGIKLMWISGCMTVLGGLIIRRIVNIDV